MKRFVFAVQLLTVALVSAAVCLLAGWDQRTGVCMYFGGATALVLRRKGGLR